MGRCAWLSSAARQPCGSRTFTMQCPIACGACTLCDGHPLQGSYAKIQERVQSARSKAAASSATPSAAPSAATTTTTTTTSTDTASSSTLSELSQVGSVATPAAPSSSSSASELVASLEPEAKPTPIALQAPRAKFAQAVLGRGLPTFPTSTPAEHEGVSGAASMSDARSSPLIESLKKQLVAERDARQRAETRLATLRAKLRELHQFASGGGAELSSIGGMGAMGGLGAAGTAVCGKPCVGLAQDDADEVSRTHPSPWDSWRS